MAAAGVKGRTGPTDPNAPDEPDPAIQTGDADRKDHAGRPRGPYCCSSSLFRSCIILIM